MDRRLFLTGMLGIAGAAALASTMKPGAALAGIPGNPGGILDDLDAPLSGPAEDGELEKVQYRPGERNNRRNWHHDRRHDRRPRRRPVWRTVCRRVRSHGRWHRRCWRERVWV